MSRTLYLIDGHAQIYRAYYARIGNLTAPSGEPTRATYVFCQMVLNLLRDRSPDYLAMVMDVSDETVFRKDIYSEYKAHRDPPPEDLPAQADRIVEILEAVGIPILRRERFEADDIMATLAGQLADEDLNIFLVSKDKDLEQLLSDRVAMYDPGKNEVITPERLFESKGWRPEQVIDVQTLTGDSVDNVPGVAGIGPKTAAKLIAKYGSARGVVEHADELTPKQAENLRAFAPNLDLTRQLVTLRADVPIGLDLPQADCRRFDWSAVRPIFEELGFRRLLEQMGEPRHEGEESDEATERRSDEGSCSGRAPHRP
jgi:DNA polymerase-1